MSRHADILAAVKTAFDAIATFVTVDYCRDLAAEPYQSDEVPALNIVESGVSSDPQVSLDNRVISLTVTIVSLGVITRTDLVGMVSSLVASINTNYRWGGLASGTCLDGYNFAEEQLGDNVCNATIDMRIFYTCAKGTI